MSRRVGRKNNPAKPVRNGYTRRTILKGGAVAAGIAVVGGLVGLTFSGENYAEWWERTLKPARGKVFIHDTHRPKVQTTREQREDLIRELIPQISPQLRGEGYSSKSFIDINQGLKATYGYSALDVSPEVLREYQRRSQIAFEQFYDFIGHPELMPTIEMHLLRKDTKLEPPIGKKVPLYVAWQRTTSVRDTLYAIDPVNRKRLPIEVTKDFGNSVRGEVDSDYQSKFLEDKGPTMLGIKYNLIYVGAGYDAVGTYVTPLSEGVVPTLHMRTMELANKEVTKWWEELGKPKTVPYKDMQDLVEVWNQREDSFLESLLNCFMLGKLGELGVSQQDVESRLKHGAGRYKDAPKIREHVAKSGAPAVFDMYFEDADRLFE